MKPQTTQKLGKICRRCNKKATIDIICPACKNELIASYENKLSWRTAYEVERISKKAMRFSYGDAEEELY